MHIFTKLQRLGKLNAVKPWVLEPEYIVTMGSVSYGVSGESSDVDIYSMCIPPPEIVFPHTTGMVPNFGPAPQHWSQWQEHHIKINEGTKDEKEYDLTSYNIVDFFMLAAQNNPNMIDALFVPNRCVNHCTDIAKVMRENRQFFLNKGAYHKFKGYALSQMKKIRTKEATGKRVALVDEFGYDTKFAYHVVRLANECQQILTTGDLDLEQNREELKAIRRGEWTLDEFTENMKARIMALDSLYLTSKLQHSPDWNYLNQILLVCLESKYGSLNKAMITDEGQIALQKLAEIARIVNK